MNFIIGSIFLIISSFGYGISKQDTPYCPTNPNPEKPKNFWCKAEPSAPIGKYYIRTGKTLEEAKNSARSRCVEINEKCVVMECGQGVHPFAVTCVASKLNENKLGGFFAYGKSAEEAWKVAYFQCFNWQNQIERKWGCKVLCFPSDIKDEN